MYYFVPTIFFSFIFVFENSSAVLPEKAESSNLTGQNKRILTKEDALDFVRKVKTQCVGDNDKKYNKFLEILDAFKKQQIDPPKVYQEVHELFNDNEELFGEFLKFMPEEYHKNGNKTPKRRKIEIKKEKGIKIENTSAGGNGSDDAYDKNGGQKAKNLANENGQKLKQPKKEP